MTATICCSGQWVNSPKSLDISTSSISCLNSSNIFLAMSQGKFCQLLNKIILISQWHNTKLIFLPIIVQMWIKWQEGASTLSTTMQQSRLKETLHLLYMTARSSQKLISNQHRRRVMNQTEYNPWKWCFVFPTSMSLARTQLPNC